MEQRGSGRRKPMKVTQCMPRLRSSRPVAASPAISLLERLREVVFKLIMISAFSKSGRRTQREREGSPAAHRQPDSYRSEAVEDCIEFFKRSSEGAPKTSNVSEDSMDHIGYKALTLL